MNIFSIFKVLRILIIIEFIRLIKTLKYIKVTLFLIYGHHVKTLLVKLQHKQENKQKGNSYHRVIISYVQSLKVFFNA